MVSDMENIYKSYTFVGGEKEDDFNTVLTKSYAYFVPQKKNIIHERARFNQFQPQWN